MVCRKKISTKMLCNLKQCNYRSNSNTL